MTENRIIFLFLILPSDGGKRVLYTLIYKVYETLWEIAQLSNAGRSRSVAASENHARMSCCACKTMKFQVLCSVILLLKIVSLCLILVRMLRQAQH